MRLIISVFSTFVLSSSAFAHQLSSQPSQGQVLFKASALGLRFEGKGPGPTGEITIQDNVTGTLTFKMAALDTGIEMRNRHMKENYLETDQYPESKLRITKLIKFDPQAAEQETGFEGQLTVRNIEKPVTNGRVKISKTETGYQVIATFDTKISEFAIPIPKYAGVVVKDDLHIVTTALFNTK